nr:hypothetical protein [Moraxella catarrhalis]
MQEHMANYRSDSAFNMQLFGNANADANDIPDDALIISNIVDGRTLEKGYVIANGLKININAALVISRTYIGNDIENSPIIKEAMQMYQKTQEVNRQMGIILP